MVLEELHETFVVTTAMEEAQSLTQKVYRQLMLWLILPTKKYLILLQNIKNRFTILEISLPLNS
jgi:hypothetical protein